MSSRPAASIAIPVYNGSRYLRVALESALAQRQDCDGEIEILVVDNGSTDETPQVIAELAGRAFRHMRYESTVPMAASWNRALGHSSGEYVALLHADDVLEPGMLRRSLTLLHGEPRVGFCFGACRFIDNDGRVTAASRPYESDRVFEARHFFARHVRGNFIYCPTVVLRREACPLAEGPFRSDVRHILDWDLWLRMELAGWKVGYVSEFQARYRLHPASASSEVEDRLVAYEEAMKVLVPLLDGTALPDWAESPAAAALAQLSAQVAFKTLRRHFRDPPEKAWALAGRALAMSRSRLGLAAYVGFARELTGLCAVGLWLAVRSAAGHFPLVGPYTSAGRAVATPPSGRGKDGE